MERDEHKEPLMISQVQSLDAVILSPMKIDFISKVHAWAASYANTKMFASTYSENHSDIY